MHRILLAHDGSTGADEAARLVHSLSWPPGTTVRIVTSVLSPADIRRSFGPLAVAPSEAAEDQLVEYAHASADAVQRVLEGPGIAVETEVVRGRAPGAIVAAAAAMEATLVVVGSRGRGAVAATLLGSVSEEVVDASPAPVLVARSPHVRTVVLGTDGSEAAAHAEEVLASLPLPPEAQVHVVGAVDVAWPISAGIAPTVYADAMAFHSDLLAQTRREMGETAAAAAARLVEAGLRATPEVVSGDPGWELVEAARRLDADLVVVGSRGRTGLTRILLGSVARRVLRHAHCSVLVARART